MEINETRHPRQSQQPTFQGRTGASAESRTVGPQASSRGSNANATTDSVNFTPGWQEDEDRLPAGMAGAFMANYGPSEPAPTLTGKDRPAPGINELPARNDQPTQIVGRPERPDPSRRNVIVLDDFRTNDNHIKGTSSRSHGEAIARPLETQGYNVYRVQDSDLDDKSKNKSQQNSLDHLAERIQRGEIPARPGDVVNLSFGQSEKMTFKDVNRLAGYNRQEALSKENLTPEKAALLRERLQQRLDQPGALSAGDREKIKDILETSAGIDRLKSMGLVVINAAGNEGPDGLHPGFLNSNHMLQNRNGDGSWDPTSARHALTEPARGSFTSRNVKGGVDVNNDGIADFERRYQGRPEDLSGTSFSVLEFLRRAYPPGRN